MTDDPSETSPASDAPPDDGSPNDAVPRDGKEAGASERPEEKREGPTLHARKLGKTDLRLSEISLGTWGLSGAYGPISAELFKETVAAAREAGVTTFDVAPLWGAGRAEEIVGEALGDVRDEVCFITRAGYRWKDAETVDEGWSVDALRADCEASLARLNTDRIDVWLLHAPPRAVLLQDEVYALAAKLKEEGKIRAWGITARGVDEARLALARECDALCLVYNLLRSDDLKDLEADIDKAGAGVIVRSPLFHGLLSGRWTQFRQFAPDDQRRDRWNAKSLQIRVRQVNYLRYLVRGGVPSMSAAAVRYVLAHGAVTTALLGARRPIQIRTAAQLAGEPPYLPEEDLGRLQKVLAEAGG